MVGEAGGIHKIFLIQASRRYRYDSLGRPTTRDVRQEGNARQDRFGYNTRSELTDAQLGLDAYRYSYDNIGNRKAAQGEAEATYTANALNQYTRIERADGSTHFSPTYDADGNQTLVKTGTGVWSVEYNAENRPVTFSRTEGDVTTRITCTYDTMGRRATKKVESNGETTLHQRYLYRGYLQIAACDLTSEGSLNLWHILWDPTQPVATRPLAIRKDGTWYAYGWDLTKNICEVFEPAGYIRSVYTYSPFGKVATVGDIEQPIQWSSEYIDRETMLTYYNHRYYIENGRFINRDTIQESGGSNLYRFALNNPVVASDVLGQRPCICCFKLNTGLLTVDSSCRGKLRLFVIDEDNAAPRGATSGTTTKADGFVIGGITYKIHGSTCVTLSCQQRAEEITITMETCVNGVILIANLFGKSMGTTPTKVSPTDLGKGEKVNVEGKIPPLVN